MERAQSRITALLLFSLMVAAYVSAAAGDDHLERFAAGARELMQTATSATSVTEAAQKAGFTLNANTIANAAESVQENSIKDALTQKLNEQRLKRADNQQVMEESYKASMRQVENEQASKTVAKLAKTV